MTEVQRNGMRIGVETDNMQKYTDLEINFKDEFIYSWIVEIFYQLHPKVSKSLKQNAYAKITKENMFVPNTPFLSAFFARK